MYPVSSKHTKFIASDQKRITKEEFEKLPHVVMGRDDEKIGSNIVFQTENSKLYAEAILSDYGIGLLAKFAPDIFDVDYKLFKMYEPFHDEELVITILSKGKRCRKW